MGMDCKNLPHATRVILAGIFLLGLFLRLSNLDVAPPGFNADEAALGYNAYSLLKTGKDEWGTSWPLVFKSFSDYKPGLYVYLDLPFVAILGLNELSVRLPSIILGALSILLIYFLSQEFFGKKSVALASSFLLAISPWHLHYSRGAWETNVATFFMLAGVLTFVKSLTNLRWLWLSVLSLVSAMYTYQTPRLIIPILIFLLVIFYWKKLMIKKNIAPAFFMVVLMIPLMVILSTNAGLARFQGVSIFSDPGPWNRTNQERGYHQNPGDFWARFYHNRLIAYGGSFLSHYLDHFSPNFLFINGDSLGRNKVPGIGQMYLLEIFTILAGFYFWLKGKFENTKIIFLWLMIAPLAASLTYQTPHVLRAHNMVVPLTLVSGLGLGILLEKIWQLTLPLRYLLMTLLSFSTIIFISGYFHQYFIHLPKQYALEWEYGFSQVVPYVMTNLNKYQKIVITNRYDQPYILFLFYSSYDPIKYQQDFKTVGENNFGFSTVTSFDKFEFRPIAKEEFRNSKKILFVGTGEEIDQEVRADKVVDFPNGSPAFKIVGT